MISTRQRLVRIGTLAARTVFSRDIADRLMSRDIADT
jgi:hypothetical protein